MFGSEFIHQEYLEDLSLCDKLIDHFNNSEHKYRGVTSNSSGEIIITDRIKMSTDLILTDEMELEYLQALKKVSDNYIKIFPQVNEQSPWAPIESAQMQHYAPGEGYYVWHTERSTPTFPYCTRHLVYMTYLNDVFDGGETEWLHQNLKVQPRKGLTVIWPADWTFVHRGVASKTENKYIVTGWYNYFHYDENGNAVWNSSSRNAE